MSRRVVKIRIREEKGRWCTADVVARNGRVVHQTDVCPYGYQATAFRRAVEWANSNGYTVESEDEA